MAKFRSYIAGSLAAFSGVTILLLQAPAANAEVSPSAARFAAPGATTAEVAYAAAKAPCLVSGYTFHAQEEMAKDRIGSDYVENVVLRYCSKAAKRSNGTWRYTDGKIVVIANNNGYIVTVWRR